MGSEHLARCSDPGSGLAHCTNLGIFLPLGSRLPTCTVRALGSMISQAPSTPAPSALSYYSLDRASLQGKETPSHQAPSRSGGAPSSVSTPISSFWLLAMVLTPKGMTQGGEEDGCSDFMYQGCFTGCKKIALLLDWLGNSHFPQFP